VINAAPLNISVATNQPSYLPGKTATVIVKCCMPLCQTRCECNCYGNDTQRRNGKVELDDPQQWVALFNFKLSNLANSGMYQVQVGATTATTAASCRIGTSTCLQCNKAHLSTNLQRKWPARFGRPFDPQLKVLWSRSRLLSGGYSGSR